MALTLKLVQDSDPIFNPRECFDNLGTMLCFHKRYSLGDPNRIGIKTSDFESWEDMEKYLYEMKDAVIVLPLYLYDHSSLAMSTRDFGDRWDSGQVGFIYVSREDVLKAFNHKRNITRKLRELVTSCLQEEVNTYDKYIQGDVWGYVILDDEGEEVESSYGFYGEDSAKRDGEHALSLLREGEPQLSLPLESVAPHVQHVRESNTLSV